MKKIVFIVLLITYSVFPQGINLELNQVLLLELIDSNGPCEIVVPDGKVWKIESAIYSLPSNINAGNVKASFAINDQECLVAQRYESTGDNNEEYRTIKTAEFPIWLPAGTTVCKNYYNESNNLQVQGENVSYLSILEFNTQ